MDSENRAFKSIGYFDYFLPKPGFSVLTGVQQHILSHTSNAKSNKSFNITYIVSSIVTQFNQTLKQNFANYSL